MDQKIIPLSKSKIIAAFVGSLIFVALGAALLFELITSVLPFTSGLAKTFSVLAIAFFGFTGFYSGKKLFDNKPGLVISTEGIHDNTSMTSVKLTEWKDILGFKIQIVTSTQLIVIEVSNPQKYIAQAKGIARKKSMNFNLKTFGSPILITSNALKIGSTELYDLLNTEFQKYKQS